MSIRPLLLHRRERTGLRPGAHPLREAGTKLARVVELLQQDRGASIDELIAVTGWLPHTTRAVLTGLRKRGFVTAIDRSDKERGSIYRVERGPAAEDSAADHSEVAQADVESLSKKMRREAKPKASRLTHVLRLSQRLSTKSRGSAPQLAAVDHVGPSFCEPQLWKRNFAARDSGPFAQRIVASTRQTDG